MEEHGVALAADAVLERMIAADDDFAAVDWTEADAGDRMLRRLRHGQLAGGEGFLRGGDLPGLPRGGGFLRCGQLAGASVGGGQLGGMAARFVPLRSAGLLLGGRFFRRGLRARLALVSGLLFRLLFRGTALERGALRRRRALRRCFLRRGSRIRLFRPRRGRAHQRNLR